MSAHELECALEALLFIAPQPLSLAELLPLVHCDEHQVKSALRRLKQRYKTRGIVVLQRDAQYFFALAPITLRVVTRYAHEPRDLSATAYEALALIAYLQPITAAQLREYHAEDATYVLQTLQDAELICCSPGENNVLFFRTTEAFLEATSLASLEELPCPDSLDGDSILCTQIP